MIFKYIFSLYHRLSPNRQELIRFICVGGFLTFCTFILMIVFDALLRWRPAFVSALSTSIMIVIGYYLQRVVTFRAENNVKKAFLSYVSVQMVGLALIVFFSEVLIGYYKIHEIFHWGVWGKQIGFAFVACLTAVINYLLLKFWTFRKKQSAVSS